MTHSCTFSDLMIIMPRICPGNSVREGGDKRVRRRRSVCPPGCLPQKGGGTLEAPCNSLSASAMLLSFIMKRRKKGLEKIGSKITKMQGKIKLERKRKDSGENAGR